MPNSEDRANERNLDADDTGLGRESKFTRLVEDTRLNRQKFQETRQQAQFDRTRATLTEEQLDEVERIAILDEATGLYNRRAFNRRFQYELKRAKRYKRPLSILILQVDKLDDIGRRMGALTKEDILKATSQIVTNTVRDVDITARISYEQLAVIFPETYSSRALIVGDRIRTKLQKEQISNELKTLRVTCSIGIVSFPTHGRSGDELFAKGMECLAIAQQQGGDRVHSY